MPRRLENKKARLIDEAVSKLSTQLPKDERPLTESFVRQYYAGVAPDDMLDRAPADVLGAALGHLELARSRRGRARKLRIYNPDPAVDGWQPTYTIVEIVTPDMPFLVDSTSMELNRHGFTVHLIVHPIIRLTRDRNGKLVKVLDQGKEDKTGKEESFIHAEIDRETDRQALATLTNDINRVLDDVRMAVEDWRKIRRKVQETVNELDVRPPPLDPDEIKETKAFLKWLATDNFTFLGYREHRLTSQGGEDVLQIVQGTGLGILRERHPRKMARSFVDLPASVKKAARERGSLVLTKANSKATVHRPSHLDYIGIKRFDAQGAVCGEQRLLGLYTSTAYQSNPRTIPVVRRKIERVMARSGLAPKSHAGKTLLNILETYPRDELFQIAESELLQTAMGILHLQERQRVRLFVRRDPFGRFLSCLVYVPRDRYTTELRERIQSILRDAFNGESVDFTVLLSESVLARIHFIVYTRPEALADYDTLEIERKIAKAVRSWRDDLEQALKDAHGEKIGKELLQRYLRAFPAAYREDVDIGSTVLDLDRIEAALEKGKLQMHLYRRPGAQDRMLQFKLFQPQTPLPLSSVIPMLENMDVMVLSESPYHIRPMGTHSVWIHDFRIEHRETDELDLEQIRPLFQEAFYQIWHGRMENDGFNRLIVRARLNWRDVLLLRACCKYLLQTRIPFSQTYMEEALANNPNIARLLVELFQARFDPALQDHAATRSSTLAADIEEAFDSVASLDEDRILRRFFGLIQAILRTNYFQRDGEGKPKEHLALKLAPSLMPELPLPRPMFEIFVYSARVEGVHMRGGKVARGGLRWSDRREDFRTEVLGLMKAQMVKNAVIVPVGAKGGFIVKQAPETGDRQALQTEGISCYQTFIRGLLDLTDNRVGDRIVPPAGVVRYDENDPYLVVAADKGTATFSDIANGISQAYKFWLGDAFASGGSSGYDHKKMAITARGAWESVKEHFYALGMDIQSTDFTVVGIGDMSGDVFGNGMLLSEHIKLIAAFNHRHIFLDPDPDPSISFRERKRLFKLAGGSWTDYRSELISKGGGVFERRAKSISLSPQARRVLDVKSTRLSPEDLIRALLRAPVDLLWNGGIGTYVKSTLEGHADAGDRTNDGVRINATELRCRVVGEGGNLGLTQRGRIQYAQHGGRINSDFIDNSGGVDCSDREVNIKIALNAAMGDGGLSRRQRDRLLVQMTDEVCAHVLRDNYRQARSISITETKSKTRPEWYQRLIASLQRAGQLDRDLEQLPDDEELARRKAHGEGMYRPEIAVLLAYAKIALYTKILASDMPDDPYLSAALQRYFPPPMLKRFHRQIQSHRLRREMIATITTNSMVNRAGISFAHRLNEQTGFTVPEIARAYMIARDVFNVRGLWDTIDTLDYTVAYELQNVMIIKSQDMLERATRWFLREKQHCGDIAATVKRYKPAVDEVAETLGDTVAGAEREALEQDSQVLEDQGIPSALARQLSTLQTLVCSLDIEEVAARTRLDLTAVAITYFYMGAQLELDRLRQLAGQLPINDQWQERARTEIVDELYQIQSTVTAGALHGSGRKPDPKACVHEWMTRHHGLIERYQDLLRARNSAETMDIAMLSVTLGRLRELTRTSHVQN